MTFSPPPNAAAPKAKVIVFGIVFWYPLAGVTYQFLHYLIGLRRLGYDVYYVEDSARYVYDPQLGDLSPDASANVAAVAPVLEAHGFMNRWAYRGAYAGGACYGMEEASLRQLYRDADAFLNVTGAQEIREEQAAILTRVYVESDPFISQVKLLAGDVERNTQLSAHNAFFTFGENVGLADCGIPQTPFQWEPTRQPVVTDLWHHQLAAGDAFNTITTWSNKGKDVDYRGETYYWTKDREFEKVIDLPRRVQSRFELATQVNDDVRRRLLEHGWRVGDAMAVSSDVDRYRQYIQSSRGEFTVARDQYVRPRTGWFSDRTACYLASGRPVITQETGFSKFIPTGRGLFAWSTIEDIESATAAIESDYVRHCADARDLASEYFEATSVLGRLMERAGL